jgi:hypothetical protein
MQVFIDPEANEISVEALNGAKAILDFVIPSTKILLENEIGESQDQRKQRKILEYLKKKGGSIDWRTLQQSELFDGGFAEYKYAVESMESAGLIQIIMDGKQIKEIRLGNIES